VSKGGGADVSKRASLVGGASPPLERDAAAGGGGRAAETLYMSSIRVDMNVLHTCDEYIDKAKVYCMSGYVWIGMLCGMYA
jgi:hypothetical protein